MVVGPRYIPGRTASRLVTDAALTSESVSPIHGTGWAFATDAVPGAPRITPPVLHPDEGSVNPVSLSVDLYAGLSLEALDSLSHSIQVRENKGHHYRIELDAERVPADRDFVLSWTPRVGQAPKAALFTETVGNNSYALLMVLPPHRESSLKRLPRETIFVIDTSGSMHGRSIEQERHALLAALDRLGPEDRFNVIQFNSFTQELFPQPVAADAASVDRAKRFVSGLRSQGGTEMLSALRSALAGGEEGPSVRQVVFMTDGSVGNEQQLFQYIHGHLGSRRLFTVGIGSAPNSHFMRQAAEFGRGTFTYIGSVDEVQEKMTELFRKLESPVLSHLELEWSDAAEVWPKRVPDLYFGEPLVVAARLPSLGGRVTVSANRAKAQPWSASFQMSAGANETGVAKLWGERRLRP